VSDFLQLTTDALSGADSYRYLRLRLDEEIARATRYQRALSLVLVDVDDLRGLNDRHGRRRADLALAELVGMVRSGARAVDRVGRWAGGAFALVLPETGLGAAHGVSERLRSDIAARRFLASSGRPLRLTVCCGVASMPLGAALVDESVVARADRALFRAKLAGRDHSTVVDLA